MLLVLKIIFCIVLTLWSLNKIMDEVYKKSGTNQERIINIIEIIVSTALIFFIYKI